MLQQKLTKNLIIPYFEYGIDAVCHTNYKGGLDSIETIIAVGETYITYKNTCNQYIDVDFRNIKLLLRPLSDLSKEIIINGEKIIPIDEIRNLSLGHVDFITTEREAWIKKYGQTEYLKKIPYGVIQKLFEYKFDVFGLLSNKKLAINI